jgi:membrane protease YdiL (CAAX protease family)
MTITTSEPSVFARVAAALRGTGPTGAIVFAAVVAAAVFVDTVIAAVLILIWALASRTPFRELGFVKPDSWVRTIALGVVLGILFKLVMKAVVMPLFGAPAVNLAFQRIQTAGPEELAFLAGYIIVGAGFSEELMYRGYLFERFRKAVGDGWPARIFIVLFCAAFFGALHFYPQGIHGVINAAFSGLILGTIFMLNGRKIWLLVVTHAAYDLTAFAIIYFHWEEAVAHAFFP